MSPRAAPRSKRRPVGAKPVEPKRPFVAHHLAPPHEILSEEESRRVLETLGTPTERLPKILASDPGLMTDPKFTALKDAHENLAGRLVRIRRPSATAGEAVAYRVVIASPLGD